MAACSSGGSSGTGDGGGSSGDSAADRGSLSVELRPVGDVQVPLGAPIELDVAIHNAGERSVTVPIDVGLRPPTGDGVRFYTASLFVPTGEEVAERVRVTPAQWYTALGAYRVDVVAGGDGGPRSEIGVEVVDPAVVIPRFEDVTEQAGVATTVPEATCGRFSNGAAWGDVEGDGDLDLFVSRLDEPSQLFVNDGAGRFTEQSSERGLSIADTNGAAFADYDNDGDTDLVVVRDASDRLLRNDGRGRFDDVSAAAGIGDDGRRGMNASWGDFDGDGHLDLYVTNYMHCTGGWTTEEEIIAQVEYHPDTLYRSAGDGTFTDVTAWLEKDAGTYEDGTTLGAGFGAAWLDVDDDGRLDLYLANDFVGPSPDHNRLWRNDGPDGAGGWTFTDISVESGTAFFMNTMGIGVGDVDRDRDVDLALSNIGANKLVRNEGDGAFTEVTATVIGRPTQVAEQPSITWGTSFHDLNLDGWQDLYVAAGNLFDDSPDATGPQPNELYVHDGETFLDVSAATGADDRGDSKGVAFADYDRDGDLDMFVINQGGSPRLYRNVTPAAGRHWVQIELSGTTSNRDACGARVTLHVEDAALVRHVSCGSGGGGSSSQHAVHFGVGTSTVVGPVEIDWPSGIRQELPRIDVDAFTTVEEPAGG
jgi:hypothetical protein